MIKTCSRCKSVKPLEQFFRRSVLRDGRSAECKECAGERRRAFQKSDHGKAVIKRHQATDKAKETKRVYEERHADRLKVIRADWQKTVRGRARHRADAKTYKSRHPERNAAHALINKLIRKGVISRGPCEVCALPEAQAHHDDYSKPLDVRWLCTKHHTEHHREELERQCK